MADLMIPTPGTDQPQNPAELGALWAMRSRFFGNDIRDMTDLVGAYNGILPQQFMDMFHPEQRVHLVNMIRLAWDDLANLAGKEMQLFVPADNDTATAKDRAEKQEMIGYGYNKAGKIAGGISMKMLMKVLAWWLVGTGNCVMMALPDFVHHNPFFTFRDPRSHFPPIGWTPYTQSRAKDALFAYQLTIGELKARYPDKADQLSRSMRLIMSGGGAVSRVDDTTVVWVGEYYHKDAWYVATMDLAHAVTLIASEAGDPGHPNVMPVVSTALYSPSGPKGRGIFSDQISIQAALARMFSQRLDFYDRTLYPLIFHTPLAGKTIHIGPYATNEYDTQSSNTPPRLDTVAPAHPVDADSTMQMAVQLSRMLNRNPESMQGAGQANSAKALEELKSAVNDTIRDQIWPPLLEVLPTLYSLAARMDIGLWGDTPKAATGRRKNAAFRVSYTPRRDLEGRTDDWEVTAGVGLAGYQGTLEIMQLVAAEQMSEQTALEQYEFTNEPVKEARRIQNDRMEKLMWADLATKAQQGQLQPDALPTLRRMVENGADLFDAVGQLGREGKLIVQMPAMMPGAPGGPGGGQMPPGAPGMNPAGGMLPAPTITALRGGPQPVGNPTA